MKIKQLTLSFILILIGVFISQYSFGQKNYQKGYIITAQNDTLDGYVNYQNWSRNPDKISFKIKKKGDEIIYTPFEIKEFKVQNEIYVSATVEHEVSNNNTAKLDFNRQLFLETTTTFLQTVFKGNKSLYHFRDKENKNNYYIKVDGDFALLVYKKYMKRQGSTGMGVYENLKYQGQLAYYLKGCSSIAQKVKTVRYTKDDLEKLFLAYYNCSADVLRFRKKGEKLKVNFGVLAGVSLTKLSFAGIPEFASLIDINYPVSVNSTGGVFVDLVFPRNGRKWAIRNEFTYAAFKTEVQHTLYDSDEKYSIYNNKFEYVHLKMYNMIRYTYPISKKIKVSLNAGLSNGFAIQEVNYQKKTKILNTSTAVSEKDAIKYTKKHEQGLVWGFGLDFERFAIEMRVDRGDGISNLITLSSKTFRNHFLLSYTFGGDKKKKKRRRRRKR